MAAKMKAASNFNGRLSNVIVNRIRESPDEQPAECPVNHRSGVWPLFQKTNDHIEFLLEFRTETRALRIVPRMSIFNIRARSRRKRELATHAFRWRIRI